MGAFTGKTLMITGGTTQPQPCVRHQCGQLSVNLRQVPAQGND